jgi:hypothetical protein
MEWQWLGIAGLAWIAWCVARITDDVREIRRVIQEQAAASAAERFESKYPDL